MSCKDILPQVKIDGIAIKQVPWSGPPGGYLPRSFSYAADEIYDIGISHTNLIQIDSFLDSFSFGDLLNATVDTPSLYNVKFLFTDDPQTYKVIEDTIKLIDEVSFFLHGDGQTATTQELKEEKQKLDNGTSNAPATVAAAAKELNKCAFKAVKQQSGGDKSDDSNKPKQAPESKDTAAKENSNQETTPPTPKVKTLIDNIIDALTDNTANSFTPTQDKIFSFSKSLEVDQKKITIQGDSLLPTITNSQLTGETFYDTQLKNFYMVVIPNVEYRENNKLIFTVRQYVSIPLVIDYEPQQYGATAEKTVSLEFLKQNPELSKDKLLQYWTDEIKKTYGERAYKTFNQNASPKSVFTTPEVSVGYNNVVNGVFFLNMKSLGENLTVFGATLEQPQLYKGVIQKVSIKKVYDDGTEVDLAPPTTVSGLTFKDLMIRGYRFTDEYDIKNFKYVVSVDAKNPLEKLVQYVMPKLVAGKKIVDDMLQQLVVAKQMKSTTILNPISGYFTDDFLESSYYTTYNNLFVQSYQTLYNLYNFLLFGEPFKKNSKKLVNTQQIMNLQDTFDEVIKTIQVLASTEGISIQEQSSQSNKKKGNKNPQPYKTISQTFDKGYMTSDGPVLFDFLYSTPPTTDGFIIEKEDLLSRVNFEGQLLNSFGVSESDNTYADNEAISITPLSIMIDEVSVDLTTYTDLDNLEDITTNILLAAEVEVQKPSSTFKGQSNTFVELLELENASITTLGQKTLKAKTVRENFYPQAMTNARPVVKAKKLVLFQDTLAAMFKAMVTAAQEELGKETAKALFLNEADHSTAVLAVAALHKLGFYDGNKIDPKHSLLNRDIPGFPQKMQGGEDKFIDLKATIKAQEVLAPFYKQVPATFMTRFMNSYQLEYISDFDVGTSKPVYSPLTKAVIEAIPDNTSMLVTLRLKAGYAIAKEYTEMHTTFIIGDAPPLGTALVYDFLPKISISPQGIISPSSVKIEQISKVAAQKKAEVFETATGAMGEQNFDAKFAGAGQPAPQPKKKKKVATPRTAPKTRSKTKKKPSTPKTFNPDAGMSTGPGGY